MAPLRTVVALVAVAALAAACSKGPAGNAAGAAPGGGAASTAPSTGGFSFAGNPCDAVFNSTLAVFQHDHADDMTLPGPDHKQSQLIQVGGKTYLQIEGAWQLSPMSTDEEVAETNKNKATATATCKTSGDDVVDGQPVTIYDAHVVNQGSTSDNRMWISKATGLPLKIESHLEGGDIATQHLRYDGVTAPVVSAAKPG